MDIYREVVAMLDTLYNEQETVPVRRTEIDFSDEQSILLNGYDSTRLNSTVRFRLGMQNFNLTNFFLIVAPNNRRNTSLR